MSPTPSTLVGPPSAPLPGAVASRPRRRRRRGNSLVARGEPAIWMAGGALVLALVMVLSLLLLVVDRGGRTFWPKSLIQVRTVDGRTLLGEETAESTFVPSEAWVEGLPEDLRDAGRAAMAAGDEPLGRVQIRTENFDLTGTHYTWVSDFEVEKRSAPKWAVLAERLAGGRFQGTPQAFVSKTADADGAVAERIEAEGPAAAWALFEARHDEIRQRWAKRRALEKDDLGRVNAAIRRAALAVKRVKIDGGSEADVARAVAEQETVTAWTTRETARIQGEIDALRKANAPYALRFETASGQMADIPVEEIVRAYPANQLGMLDKLGIYASRWWEFLSDEPREANSEGGVWPAIFGTIVMTLLMSILVVPFGVLAALYLKEYAKPGPVVNVVRIAINNLAGVPSIVFGVFGLGLFCYILGVRIDQLFYPEYAPNPVYGKGGILWASLTLALLTLPVVIVATEEALAAVPGSMREGSYACGASKWQTIRRIVLPRAMPGVITGMILAVARGAGEVAPLMLVGAVKLAPALPVDGIAPFVHPERSFMHLGFHIYDLGFQSQNSEAAKPMVFSTTLLLILIVVVLNAAGMIVRARLRKKFSVGI